MSNWDDEDFDVPLTRNNFDDEEDDGVLDSWEAEDSDEEKKQSAKPAEPTKKRVGVQQRIAEREQREREERERNALQKGEEDANTKKEREKKLQEESDLNNAATLFGEVNLHPKAKAAAAAQPAAAPSNEPTKLSDLAIFKPSSKQEFENLRKTIVPLLTELSETSNLNYSNFVIELTRDLTKALNRDQIAKVTSTVNSVANEKQRQERQNRGKKQKPVAKAASLKVNEEKDTTNYDDFDDDVDFM